MMISDYIAVSAHLKILSSKTLSIDCDHGGSDYEYTEEDIVNLIHIFGHVMVSKMVHLDTDRLSRKEIMAKSEYYALELKEMVKGMTGVDTTTYYNK